MSSEDITIITFNNQLKNEIKSELLNNLENTNKQLKNEILKEVDQILYINREMLKQEIKKEYKNYRLTEIKNIISNLGIIYLIYVCIRKNKI